MRGTVLLCLPIIFGTVITQTQTQAASHSEAGDPSAAERVYSPKDGKIKPPRAIYSPDPGYSRQAINRFKDQRVVLLLTVGSNGLPQDIKVARSLAPEVDQVAVDAVTKWRFRPATLDGKPVAVRINVDLQVGP